MKKIIRAISLFMVTFIVCGAFLNVVDAETMDSKALITQTGMNELSVRQVVNTYFAQRKAYLQGSTEDIPSAISAIVIDESKHKGAIHNANGLFVDSVILLNSVKCSDSIAKIDLTETVTLNIGGKEILEIVRHDIGVCMFADGTLEVQKDGYYISSINFKSCSYIPDEDEGISTQALGGSKLCVVNVASAEIGYMEESGTRYTKYSDYYDRVGYDWCACFVSWCIDQANIPSSIVVQSPAVVTISNFFHTEHKYYYSQSNGGTTTPQAGDLIFLFGSISAPTHIGIVTRTDSTYIYYIDGNNDGRVKSSKVTRTSSEFIGFGRPSYPTTSHSYESTWNTSSLNHWHECRNCHATSVKEEHSFTYNSVSQKYVCSVCDYTTTVVPVTPAKNTAEES